MMATCDGGNYTIPSLPPGNWYIGPHGVDDANLCYCNTVAYSLFSACGACQGQKWITWSEWVTNCTKILPPSSFPNTVPSGTSVPYWVVLNVTSENFWDFNKAFALGDLPEFGPGWTLSPSSVSVTPTSSSLSPTSRSSSLSPTSSSLSPTSSRISPTRSPTPSPAGGNGSKHAAAIAGAVIGGAAAIAAAVFAIFYIRRRSQASVSAGVGASQQQAPSLDEVALSTLSRPRRTRFYDPNDPTTFPGYLGGRHSQIIPSQVPVSSEIRARNTLENTQTSLPQASGYSGLPTV
ncbi:hypothetical protein DFH94DRAFT_354171 [Russula ochroleuca]|uniref:Uncharacterized protein n=1 Tax=Russula ochroleuca TaxID=152965 RepID=A0A9P5JVG9_9AGAM|nr:hypothetical protein DFH94DRAFT_354171 [Russula ochroleuca]